MTLQQSRFLALVSNGERLHELMDAADNSEGAGTLQYLKTLDSLESKLEQLRVTFQEFYTSMGIEDLWKGALTGLTNFISNLNKMPKLLTIVNIVNIFSTAFAGIKWAANEAITSIAKTWNKVIGGNSLTNSADILGKTWSAKLTKWTGMAFAKIKNDIRSTNQEVENTTHETNNEISRAAVPTPQQLTERIEQEKPLRDKVKALTASNDYQNNLAIYRDENVSKEAKATAAQALSNSIKTTISNSPFAKALQDGVELNSVLQMMEGYWQRIKGEGELQLFNEGASKEAKNVAESRQKIEENEQKIKENEQKKETEKAKGYSEDEYKDRNTDELKKERDKLKGERDDIERQLNESKQKAGIDASSYDKEVENAEANLNTQNDELERINARIKKLGEEKKALKKEVQEKGDINKLNDEYVKSLDESNKASEEAENAAGKRDEAKQKVQSSREVWEKIKDEKEAFGKSYNSDDEGQKEQLANLQKKEDEAKKQFDIDNQELQNKEKASADAEAKAQWADNKFREASEAIAEANRLKSNQDEVEQALEDAKKQKQLQYEEVKKAQQKRNEAKSNRDEYYLTTTEGEGIDDLQAKLDEKNDELNKINIAITVKEAEKNIADAQSEIDTEKRSIDGKIQDLENTAKEGFGLDEVRDQLGQEGKKAQDKADAKAKTKNMIGNIATVIGSVASIAGQFINTDTREGEIASGIVSTTGGLASATGQALAGNWVGAAVTGITTIFNAIDIFTETTAEKLEKATKAAEEAENKALEAKDAYNTFDGDIENLKELEKAQYDSEDAAEEYHTAMNDLAADYPELIRMVDENGNAIIDAGAAEAKLAELRKQSAQATAEAALKEANRLQSEVNSKKEQVSNDLSEFDQSDVGFLNGTIVYQTTQTNADETITELDEQGRKNANREIILGRVRSTEYYGETDDSSGKTNKEYFDEKISLSGEGGLLAGANTQRRSFLWTGERESTDKELLLKDAIDYENVENYESLNREEIIAAINEKLENFDMKEEEREFWLEMAAQNYDYNTNTYGSEGKTLKQYEDEANDAIVDFYDKMYSGTATDEEKTQSLAKAISAAEEFQGYAVDAGYSGANVFNEFLNIGKNTALTMEELESDMAALNGQWKYALGTQLQIDGTKWVDDTISGIVAADLVDYRLEENGEVKDGYANLSASDYLAKTEVVKEKNRAKSLLEDYYNGLTSSKKEIWSALLKDTSGKYNAETIINELGLKEDEDGEIIELIRNYYKETDDAVSERMTNKYLINDSGESSITENNKSGTDEMAKIAQELTGTEGNKLLSSVAENFVNEANEFIEDYDKQGFGTKSQKYGEAFYGLFGELNSIADEDTRLAQDTLAQLDGADLTSWSGIQAAISTIQKNDELSQDSKDNLIEALKALQETIISNVYVEAEALREDIKNFGENGVETISKISEGASLDDAYVAYENMIEAIKTALESSTSEDDPIKGYEGLKDKSFTDLFQMDPSEPGQYLIKDASIIEAYTVAELDALKKRTDNLSSQAEEAYSKLTDSSYLSNKSSELSENFKNWSTNNPGKTIGDYFNSGDADDSDILVMTEMLGITDEYENYLTEYAKAADDTDKITELNQGFDKTVQEAKEQSDGAIEALETYYKAYSKTLLSSNLAAAGFVRKAIAQLYKQSNKSDEPVDAPTIKSILKGDFGNLDEELKPYVLSYAEQVASDVSTLWDDFQKYGKDWVRNNFSQYTNLKEYGEIKALFAVDATGTNKDIYKYLANYMQQSTEEYNSGLVEAIEKDKRATQGAQESLANAIMDKGSGRLIFESLSDLQSFADDMGKTIDEIGYSWNDEINGYVTGITKTSDFVANIENGAAILEDSLLNLASTVNDSISDAIEGTLSAADKDTLTGNLAKMGFNLNEDEFTIDFTLTSEGYKLTKQSLADIYVNMKNINSLAADTMLDNLVESAQDADETLENIYVVLGRIEDIEKELATIEDNNKRRNELLTELDVAKQIRDTLIEAGNAFNFMDNDLPAGMTNPNSAWEGMGEAFKIFNGDEFAKGQIGFTELYNMITMMDEAGATLVTSSTKFEDNANWAQELINAAAGCMKMIDGEAFVDLGDLGTQFNLGADALQEGTTDGIHLIAQSQIDMLDAAIRILDTIATVEDLDTDSDGIDLKDIFNLNDGEVTGFTEKAETFLNKLQDVIGNLDIGGNDLKQALLNLAQSGEEGAQKVLNFISSLSTLDWTADPSTISNTIMDLIKGLFPNESITKGKSIFDILKVPDDAKSNLEEFSKWLEKVGLSEDQYTNLIDQINNGKTIDSKKSPNLYTGIKKMLGLEDDTEVSKAFDTFYESNPNKSTSEILQMWDSIGIVVDENGNITGCTYTDSNGEKYTLDSSDIEGWNDKIEQIETDALNKRKIISNVGDAPLTGEEKAGNLTLSTGEEIDYAYTGEEGDWTFYYKGQSAAFKTKEEGEAWIKRMASMDNLKGNGDVKYKEGGDSGTLTLETGTIVNWKYNANTGEVVYVASDDTEWSTLDELKEHEYQLYLGDYELKRGNTRGAKTKEQFIEQKFGVKTTIEGEVNGSTTSAQIQDLANKILGATGENGYVKVDEDLSLAFANVGIDVPKGSSITQNELLELLGVETENKILNITTNADEFSQKLVNLIGDGSTPILVNLLVTSSDGSGVEEGATVTFTVQGIEEIETLLNLLNNTDLHIIKIQYQDVNGNPINLGSPTGNLGYNLGLGGTTPTLSGTTLNVTDGTVEGDWTVPQIDLTGSTVNVTGDANVNGSCNCSGSPTGPTTPTTPATPTGGSEKTNGNSNNSSNGSGNNNSSGNAAGAALGAGIISTMPAIGIIVGTTLGTSAVAAAQAAATSIADAFKSTMNGIKSKTVTVSGSVDLSLNLTIKGTATGDAKGSFTVSKSGEGMNITKSFAKGNTALASGTLMGELGPELVVSNGRYFTVGENGPEFVNLASDAIVFNHLQTRQLLNNGNTSTHGKPVTNERKATSFAKGNAMASASEAAAQLRTIRAQWQRLLEMSASDFGKKAGSGGGGGGGGEDEGAVIGEYERWYNLLRQIEHYEKEISLEQARRENMIDGANYAASLEKELEILKKQKAAYSDLTDLQRDFYNQRRKDLLESEYSKIFTYDENGLMQYVDGKNRGLDILATLNATDKNGAAKMDAKQQLTYLKSIGFDISVLNKDASGKPMRGNSDKMQVFWDSIDSWIDEMDSLYDDYHEHAEALEETISEMNDIIQEYIDKQLSVEEALKTAIEDREQAIIDKLEDQKEALENAASAYTEGLSDALNKEKSLYNNEESQAETQKLQRQLAILQRSGGSASEIKSLQDQLDSRLKDDYFNKMQEQIDAIQDASDKEIERLDKQIEIANNALDYQKENGLLWQEVYAMMDKWNVSQLAAFVAHNTAAYKENSALQNSEDLKEFKTNAGVYVANRDSSSIRDDFYEAYGKKNNDGNLLFKVDNNDTTYDNDTATEAYEAYASVMATSGDGKAAKDAADAVFRERKEWANNQFNNKAKALGLDEETDKDVIDVGKTALNSTLSMDDALTAMRTKALAILDSNTPEKIGSKRTNVYRSASLSAKTWGIGKAGAAITSAGGFEVGEDRDGKATVFLKCKWGKNTGYIPADSLAWNDDIWSRYKNLLTGYSSGGLNTSIGPAMLHGTSSKPEAILNATDTKFFREQLFGNGEYSLRKTIEAVQAMQSNLSTASENNVDNSTYYNFNGIEIKIESDVISNDYDAQAAGDKIMEQLTALARKSQNIGVSRR